MTDAMRCQEGQMNLANSQNCNPMFTTKFPFMMQKQKFIRKQKKSTHLNCNLFL